MTAAITLSPDENTDDATGDFLGLRAVVTCRGFTGQTRLSLARRDLTAFATELATLVQAHRDCALLLGGWEREARLRIRIAPSGTSGRFLTHVSVASTGAREDQWHRVETEFVCMPDAVSAFLA